MSNQSRYREIEVSGSPREIGQQIGEAAREEVRAFCAIALERLNKTVKVTHEKTKAVSESCIPLAESYSQDSMDELRGIAEAADLPLWEVMLLQIRNQFSADADSGCTSLSLPANSERGMVVAQNWDSDPALDPFTVVLTRRPTGKPAFMSVTQAGLIAYVGCNDAGIAACLNTLPAPSQPKGVPHYFTLRELYEAKSLEEAANAIQRANRAIPVNIMLATPEGPADIEASIDNVYVLRPDASAWITHTNHCLHPEICEFNEQFPELIESHPRKARIDSLLNSYGTNISIDDIKTVLRDHEGHPRSICRHVNDHEETGFWQTVFSVIIEPEQKQMHVTRGTPCDSSYETYQL